MPRMRHKAHLPWKICAHCGRPFTWRRKWARDWERVRYCSNACRHGVPALAATRKEEGPWPRS
ncbi:MAG: DUF2256 domain-containing protein [Sphingomonadaceae bacterium]|uniref:DUF2256 domain-containing protein n=1 Tax=Thermaurantiacus sp. TaxID=2820283 RepID=UPI00298F1260|nr:DUF2256 domain-containing protein [Thermaurantiacus sp.]MCS6987430.1 DUF2256 domain-containing protein [Sphingomonadaceae bacterium]MDW8415350.1 DUF2256 domain-containing protein [Thermaurantiacus sp.]